MSGTGLSGSAGCLLMRGSHFYHRFAVFHGKFIDLYILNRVFKLERLVSATLSWVSMIECVRFI